MNHFFLKFQVHYKTEFGQKIVVQELGEKEEDKPAKVVPLTYAPDGVWKGSYELLSEQNEITYRYLCIDDSGQVLDQEFLSRTITDLPVGSITQFIDTWRALEHPENGLYNSAFTNVIFRPQLFPSHREGGAAGLLTFSIEMPRITGSHRVCIIGNISELGHWNVDEPLLLENERFPIWSGSMPAPANMVMEYKYGIFDSAEQKVIAVEQGPNRQVDSGNEIGANVRVNDLYFRFEKMEWKGAGISMPIFSLRTADSFGVGEFADLIPLVDWASSIGFKLIQTLPINDTSATGTALDSLPYSAISVYALHPLYLKVESLAGFAHTVDEVSYTQRKKELNALSKYDYLSVVESKLNLAKACFALERKTLFASTEFKSFFRSNEHWLRPYALFCALRDKYKTPTFSKWDQDAVFDQEKMLLRTSPSGDMYEPVLFYFYLQYYLDKQLFAVSKYARNRGVVLKGDIPIGIYRDSVDAWTNPHLFNMESQAGAPPDPFSKLGQNWGFPTYKWEVMQQDGYTWWQNRLRFLARYFDVFRIDHILGFFRIWQIPYDQMQGLLGYFNPAIPVTPGEFEAREIPFEASKLCRPSTDRIILEEVFGEESDYVLKTFFKKERGGRLVFKKSFDSQRKIYEHFKKAYNRAKVNLQPGLFRIMSDVLFVKDLLRSNAFHPRIDFQDTYLFRSQSEEVQEKLNELYHDYFYVRQESFWAEQAREKLPALKSATDMQICGEDLGMIPACVPPVMKDFALLSLEIQRMSKNPKTTFLHVDDIPYLSVCSTSTHDMSPLRAWWEETESETIQSFYEHELLMEGDAPDICTGLVAEKIVQMHFHWPSMWAIIPMQDLLAMNVDLRGDDPAQERINVPSASTGNWQYRLHFNLELLDGEDAWNEKLRLMLKSSSRLMS